MAHLSDEELQRMACEELMQEAKRGAVRVESEGSMGWLKSTQPKTNKRFLQNTVVNIVMFNKSKQKEVIIQGGHVDRRRKHLMELKVNEEIPYKLRKK